MNVLVVFKFIFDLDIYKIRRKNKINYCQKYYHYSDICKIIITEKE